MSWHIYPAAAAAAVRRSVGPSVSPRHEAGSFLSSLTSVHVGGAQVAHPTGGGPWTYSLPNDTYIQKKRKKEIWVSLSRRAQIPHSTRTKVHGSAPLHPHHKPALHYLLVLATDLLRRERCRMFQIKDVWFFCSAVLLPETYGIPYHHHAPLQGGKTTPSSPAVLYLTYLTLLELGGSSSNYICTSDGTRKGTKRKKNCSARCILAALGSRVLYAGRPRRQPRHCITSLPTSLARLPRPPACVYCRYHGCICLKRRGSTHPSTTTVTGGRRSVALYGIYFIRYIF